MGFKPIAIAEARKKGLSCGKKNFWQIIRNPVYCGKIFISKYKDEEAHLVQGQHEPIVSEGLFYQAMDAIDGRKRAEKTKIVTPEELPLRGFLICPKCGYKLSGSASKGYSKYYHYYHCFPDYGVRYNSVLVNKEFLNHLAKHALEPKVCDLYKTIITQMYEAATGEEKTDLALYKRQG